MGVLQFLSLNKKKLNKHQNQQHQKSQKKQKSPFSSNSTTSSFLSIFFSLLKMFFFSIGICTCFCLWSVKQERIVTKPYVITAADGKLLQSAKLSTVFVFGLAQSVVGTLIGLFMLFVEKFVCKTFFSGGEKKLTPKTKTTATGMKEKVTIINRNKSNKNRNSNDGDSNDSDRINTSNNNNHHHHHHNNNNNHNISKSSNNNHNNSDDVVYKNDTVVKPIKRDLGKILKMTIFMGFANAFGASLGYGSMRRLPYPVVLAAKMSKMVPVMLVGFFWYGTRYSLKNCMACAVITFGVMCFYLLNDREQSQYKISSTPSSSPSSSSSSFSSASWIGFLMLFINLITDGFMNSTQQVLIKSQGLSSYQLMILLNFATAIWLLFVLIALEALYPLCLMFLAKETKLAENNEETTTLLNKSLFTYFYFYMDSNIRYFVREVIPLRDLSLTIKFFTQYPEAMYDVVIMSLLNAAGQVFIFSTISSFGMLTFLALTLLRKAGSVLLSVSIHGHDVAVGQWVSLLVVLIGAVWEGLMNVRRSPPPPPPPPQQQQQRPPPVALNEQRKRRLS